MFLSFLYKDWEAVTRMNFPLVLSLMYSAYWFKNLMTLIIEQILAMFYNKIRNLIFYQWLTAKFSKSDGKYIGSIMFLSFLYGDREAVTRMNFLFAISLMHSAYWVKNFMILVIKQTTVLKAKKIYY